MNYANIIWPSYAEGPGCRVSLFVTGCNLNCPGCHNKDLQDKSYGFPYSEATETKLNEILSKNECDGLSLLGGEPLYECNYQDVLALAKRVKEAYPNKTIWCYTGYTTDYVKKHRPEIIDVVDFMVTGPYVEKLRDITLTFMGSSNQEIVDCKTLRNA